jgi:hypothetical protein
MFTWEIPLLGWAFIMARTVPSLLLPPIVGLIGQRDSSPCFLDHETVTEGQSTAIEAPR